MKQVILQKTSNTRKRKAPEVWQKIIAEACRGEAYPKIGFGYADIQEIAQSHNVNITYESLRVKFDRYRRSSYVKKISRGRFHVPNTGYYFFDLL